MDRRNHHLPPPPPRPPNPNLYFPRHPPLPPPHHAPPRPPTPTLSPSSQLFRPPPPPPPRTHQFRPIHEDRRRYNYPVPELSLSPRDVPQRPHHQRPAANRRSADFDDRVTMRVNVNRPIEFDQNPERLRSPPMDEFDREQRGLLHNRPGPGEFDREPQRLHHRRQIDQEPQRLHHNRPIDQELQMLHPHRPIDQERQMLQHHRLIEFDQNPERLRSRPVSSFDGRPQRLLSGPGEFHRETQTLHHRRPIDQEPQRLHSNYSLDRESRRLHHHRPLDQEPQMLHHHRPIEYEQDHQPHNHHPIGVDQEAQCRLQHPLSAEFDRNQQRLPIQFDQEWHRLPTQFDHEKNQYHQRQQQIDLRSMSPGLPDNRFSRHDSAEGTFRTRFVEFDSNGNGGHLREEIVPGCRDEFPRLSRADLFNGNGFNPGSVSSQELGTNTGSYDRELVRNCRGGGMSEMERFDHNRITHKDLHDRMGDGETGRGDGSSVFSEKDEYYSSDLGKYDTRSSRDVSREMKHTPKKQLQKKSAFLRIQRAKPTYRNKDDDRLHYSGNPNNTNSSSPYKGNGHPVEKRSGSPMELDVSFKSNALIAKAMSSVPSETYMTQRNTKIRKVMDSRGDSSNIPSKIEGKGFTLTAKNSEKLKYPDVGNMLGNSVKPGSSKTNVPTLRSVVVLPSKELVSDKGDNNMSIRSSSNVKRKKKIMKKVISRPRASILQSTKKQDESVVVDGSTLKLDKTSVSDKCTFSVKEKNIFSGNDLLGDVNLQPSVTEQTSMPNMNRLDGSSQDARLANHGTDMISGMESGCRIEVLKNTCAVASSSLNGIEMEVTKDSTIADKTSCGLAATSNFDVDLVTLSCDNAERANDGMGYVTKQFAKKDPLAYENFMEEQPKTSQSIEGKANCVSSSWGNVTKDNCFVHDKMISELGSENCSVNSIERNAVADAVGYVNDIPCIDNFRTSTNTTGGVGIVKSSTSSRTSVALSSSEESRIHHCLSIADNSNNRSGTIYLENTGTNLGRYLTLIGKGSNVSDMQHTTIPFGIVFEGTNPTDRKTSSNEVDISRTDNVCFGSSNVVSPFQEIDTTLSIYVKSPGPSEVKVSGFGSMNIDLQPSKDRPSILDNNNLEDLSGDKVRNCLVEADGCTSGHETSSKDAASGLVLSTANAHEMSEILYMTDASVPTAEFPSDDEIGITQPKEGAAEISDEASEGAKYLLGDSQIRRSSEAVGAVYEDADDNVKLNLPCIFEVNSTSDAVPCEGHACLDVPVIDEGDEMEMEIGVGKKLELPVSDEGKMAHDENFQSQEPRHKSSASESFNAEDGLSSECNPLIINTAMATKADLSNEMEHVIDKKLQLGSPETLSHVPPMQLFDDIELTSCGQISRGSIQEDEKEPNEKQVLAVEQIFSMRTSSIHYPSSTIPDHAVENEAPSQKMMTLFSSDSNSMIEGLDCAGAEDNQVKIKPSDAFSKAPQGRNMASSTRIGKAHIWRRDESAISLLSRNKPSLQKKFSSDLSKMQSTSYIRKGNSLVRKAVQSATLPLNPSIYRINTSLLHDLKQITTSENKAGKHTGDVHSLGSARIGGVNVPSERPKTQALLSDIIDPSPPVPIFSECTPSLVEDASGNGCNMLSETDIISDALENPLKTSEPSQYQINTVCNPGSKNNLNEKDFSSNIGSLVYVKPKSNQLVAASNNGDLSVQGMQRPQALLPDSYYKKSNNQLIRTSDENLNLQAQRGSKVATERNCGKNHLHKVTTKRHKLSKLPLVWTLCGTRSSKNDGALIQHLSVFSNLFPWKRATYRRSFMQNSTSLSNKSFSMSLSLFSRRLWLSRKMDMVYTRSLYGYSIQKSKVLSIGGANLKWSKSMEIRSKISNKEATKAAASAEKKKKEKDGAVRVSSGTKNRGCTSKRIFRIGSFRYKMDPSKRTLHRIPDEESSESANSPFEKNKQCYVPRRLVIGSDEYVRIGNGNQLVRDPKKRLRVLASEKVRWSLHTVRQRLAKKRKYCQFFTRFGKCNKDNGKCPYIHDRSKVSVCTKFLNGLCSNPNCKLTHKIIPERMPDCSYFLQGLCVNKDCPYRHVNTDPDAPTCEGFLRGYCVDGDECQKKHSYVCPIFEVRGSCPQGSKCKLHHPKIRTRTKKRKRSGEQDKSRGRYFGPMDLINSESRMAMEKNLEQNDGDCFFEGSLPDYIPLDISSDEETKKDFKRRKQLIHLEDVSLSGGLEDMILPQPKLIQPKSAQQQVSTVELSPGDCK